MGLNLAGGELDDAGLEQRFVFRHISHRRGMLSFRIAMKRYLRPVILASLCAAPLALGLHAQQAPAQQPQAPAPAPAAEAPVDPNAAAQAPAAPAFRTDINFVRVDVIVSDKKGSPIADLPQQDLE